MNHRSHTSLGFSLSAVVLILFGGLVIDPGVAWSSSGDQEPLQNRELRAADIAVDSLVFETPPPPFRDPDIFPCSDCHNEDQPTNPLRRDLEDMHEDIVLRHDEEHRWCLDCHDADDRDKLRLANGTLIPFEKSYQLCGQCHGDKYRDWRVGVHGRRSGDWNGEKKYLLCVHCHYSHAPRFQPIAPEPAPTPPGKIQ